MKRNLWLAGALALAVALTAVGCSPSEPQPAKTTVAPPTGPSPSVAARPVPPYHESAEAAKPFPRLVPAEYFRGYPLVQRAYRIAAGIPEVVAQQPCYCYCNKIGHRSLLDCFASDHGAG